MNLKKKNFFLFFILKIYVIIASNIIFYLKDSMGNSPCKNKYLFEVVDFWLVSSFSGWKSTALFAIDGGKRTNLPTQLNYDTEDSVHNFLVPTRKDFEYHIKVLKETAHVMVLEGKYIRYTIAMSADVNKYLICDIGNDPKEGDKIFIFGKKYKNLIGEIVNYNKKKKKVLVELIPSLKYIGDKTGFIKVPKSSCYGLQKIVESPFSEAYWIMDDD